MGRQSTFRQMFRRFSVAALLPFGVFFLGVLILLPLRSVRLPQSVLPSLSTNEQYLEHVRQSSLNVTNENILDVFAYVFSQLSETVDVYPTENYYYYRFWSDGNEIWGNIRLDVDDREKGLASFAYFTFTEQPDGSGGKEPVSNHKNIGKEDGLVITKQSPLVYDLTYREKTVTFRLHDIPQTLPEGLTLTDDEEFLFRAFDESGFQFIFVYDHRANSFRYLLDPTAPLPDTLNPVAKQLLVGYRTGFAFYDDTEHKRNILIGVRQENVRRNNYYDGPFDQLADNWLPRTKFQEYATRVYPSLRVDSRGFFLNEKGERAGNRLAVQAYMQYGSLSQLTWLVWHCENEEEYFLGCISRDPNSR